MAVQAKTIPRKIKVAILALLGAGLSFAAFHFFYNFLKTAEFSDLWMVALMALVFLVVLVLDVIFLRESRYAIPLALLGGLVPILLFIPQLYPDPSLFVVVGILALALFLVIAVGQGAALLSNSLSLQFFSVAHRILPRAVIGFLLCFSLIGYWHYFHLGNFSDEVGSAWFSKALGTSAPVLQAWFPGVTFDMTVRDAVAQVGEVQLRRSKVELLRQGINIDELPLSTQRRLIEEASEGIRSVLERVGGPFVGDETLSTFLYNAVKTRVAGLAEPIQAAMGGGLIVIMFFVLKGVAFMLYYPVALVSFVIYKLLLLTGFAYITLENRQQEVVSLS